MAHTQAVGAGDYSQWNNQKSRLGKSKDDRLFEYVYRNPHIAKELDDEEEARYFDWVDKKSMEEETPEYKGEFGVEGERPVSQGLDIHGRNYQDIKVGTQTRDVSEFVPEESRDVPEILPAEPTPASPDDPAYGGLFTEGAELSPTLVAHATPPPVPTPEPVPEPQTEPVSDPAHLTTIIDTVDGMATVSAPNAKGHLETLRNANWNNTDGSLNETLHQFYVEALSPNAGIGGLGSKYERTKLWLDATKDSPELREKMLEKLKDYTAGNIPFDTVDGAITSKLRGEAKALPNSDEPAFDNYTGETRTEYIARNALFLRWYGPKGHKSGETSTTVMNNRSVAVLGLAEIPPSEYTEGGGTEGDWKEYVNDIGASEGFSKGPYMDTKEMYTIGGGHLMVYEGDNFEDYTLGQHKSIKSYKTLVDIADNDPLNMSVIRKLGITDVAEARRILLGKQVLTEDQIANLLSVDIREKLDKSKSFFPPNDAGVGGFDSLTLDKRKAILSLVYRGDIVIPLSGENINYDYSGSDTRKKAFLAISIAGLSNENWSEVDTILTNKAEQTKNGQYVRKEGVRNRLKANALLLNPALTASNP